MNKAVFLDRDGTINFDRGYVHKIKDFEYMPGAIEGIRLFQEAGYLIIIITNQSGIARGIFEEKDYKELTRWMLHDLNTKGILVERVYMCPHLPNGIAQYRKKCLCRKPNTGLFFQAAHDYNIDLSKSIAIGNNKRDLCICKESKCKGYLIDTTKKYVTVNDNYVRVNSIYDAALAVLRFN